VVYVREAHPTDSNWEDPTLDVVDPTTDLERRLTAKRCADSLGLDVPMVVDGVDDAVNMAYSAWPERLYVLKPGGVIHYKGDLGPSGFKPAAAAAALAELLGEAPPKLGDTGAAPECEDDGFSGKWEGTGAGRILRGDFPVYAKLALGTDGTVGGKLEVSSARYPMPLIDASYEKASGVLTGQVAMQGRRMQLRGKVTEQKVEAQITGPNGMELFAFTAERVQKGFALVPGPADPTGTWSGAATAKDPAQAGKQVTLVLTGDAAQPLGSLTIGGQTATIQRSRYRPKTGDFACLATTEGGGQWRINAVITPAKVSGTASMGRVALVVGFECTRAKKPAEDDGAEDF
jgi:type I thyroxine 5'-deiodinase